MDEIKRYLEGSGQDYAEGLSLLDRVCSNKTLIRNLRLKENTKNRDKLQYELGKYSQLPAKEPLVKPKRKIEKRGERILPGKPAEPAMEPELPPEVADIVKKISQLHNERGKLSNSLRTFAADDNAGRKKVIDQIDAITQEMGALREQRLHFQRYGLVPDFNTPSQKVLPGNILELHRLLQNAKSNRSKWRNKKDKAGSNSPQWISAENKLMQLEKEIVELEATINIRAQQSK